MAALSGEQRRGGRAEEADEALVWRAGEERQDGGEAAHDGGGRR